ncbi:MAG: hypothetical protein J6A53_00030 [Clostridia bacterium]|nr:hypothetical protein [Clostridia bacterium]
MKWHIKKHKNIIIVISLVALGIILILFGTNKQKQNKTEVNFDYENYAKELENKIEDFLLSIEGIKKARVMVTLDTTFEKVYAQNQSTLDLLTINTSDGKSPVYITEVYPTVRGIAIACTNGDNDEVKMKITRLISAYLGISSNRIEIVSFG